MNAILLLYHHFPSEYASTVMDSVDSFSQYSQFRVFPVNTYLGYPRCLDHVKFSAVVLHYSMFSSAHYLLQPQYLNLLERHADAYKIAVWQDECYNFKPRYQFVNKYKIDCIYTCLQPQYFNEVYYSRCPSVKKVIPTLTGYVSKLMCQKAEQFAKPFQECTVDVGYRARGLDCYLGKGGLEKIEIANKFLAACQTNNTSLVLDIKCSDNDRIYGDKYWRWLGNLKAILGAESGGSIFDLESEVYDEWRRKQGRLGRMWERGNKNISYDEMPAELMQKWEGKVSYRAISPRFFEAAAFNICQVLYRGEYNGILKPWVHYLPLERDFRNFHQIVHLMQSEKGQQVIKRAHADLIDSGKYTFKAFIEGFDINLINQGLNPKKTADGHTFATQLSREVARLKVMRSLERLIFLPYYAKYPGKRFLMPLAGLAGSVYFMLKGYKKGAA